MILNKARIIFFSLSTFYSLVGFTQDDSNWSEYSISTTESFFFHLNQIGRFDLEYERKQYFRDKLLNNLIKNPYTTILYSELVDNTSEQVDAWTYTNNILAWFSKYGIQFNYEIHGTGGLYETGDKEGVFSVVYASCRYKGVTNDGLSIDKKLSLTFRVSFPKDYKKEYLREGKIISSVLSKEKNPYPNYTEQIKFQAQTVQEKEFKHAESLFQKGNLEKAIPLLKAVARKYDNSTAKVYLGCFYSDINEIEEAKYWLTQAKDSEHWASLFLAQIHIRDQEIEQAIPLLENASNLGNGVASLILGLFVLDGKYLPKNIKQSKRYIHKAAIKGVPKAQSILGDLLIAEGMIEDGIHWYTLASNAGEKEACIKLGSVYEKVNDYKNALIWYEKAASNNNAEALIKLGLIYFKGNDNINRNLEKAVQYITSAAESGLPEAQSFIGTLYMYGASKEIERDYKKARYWLSKAALNGKESAKSSLKLLTVLENTPDGN